MRDKTTVDLLNGSPAKALARLALPVIGASFIQMLYNFTDLYWISSLGASALAAVGTGGTFLWMSEGFGLFARMGGQILTGQSYGRGDRDEVKRVAAVTLQLGLLLGLLVCLTLVLGHKPLIAFFRFHEADTVRYAERYLAIVALGVPFGFLTRILGGLLAACGNTRTTLQATLTGLTCNMILDPLFILVFGWGPAGAAAATVLSQMLVFGLLVIGSRRTGLFSGIRLLQRYPRHRYQAVLKLGVPSGLQTMLYAGISILLGRVVAGFGDLQVAAQRVSSQIESLTWTVADAFAVSINAFTAQNTAAGRPERLRQGYRASLGMSAAIGLLGMIIMVLFPNFVAGLFFHLPAEIAAARAYLIIVGLSQIFMCVEIMSSGTFAGLGNPLYPSVVVTSLTALRLPAAYALSATALAVTGVWWSISLSSIVKGIVLFLSVEYVLRHRMGRIRAGGPQG